MRKWMTDVKRELQAAASASWKSRPLWMKRIDAMARYPCTMESNRKISKK